jgi:DNA helicase-2/ATP-dependent DNA helicase PcrA
MEEGILPLYNGGEPDRKEIEEERRLCYVGMTRAMRRLYCSNARVRHRFGEYLTQAPSRFLGEIPPELSRTLPSTMGLSPSAGFESRTASPARQRRRSRDEDTWYHSDPEVSVEEYASDSGALKRGSLVEHEQFGRGRVVDVEFAGESTRAVVDFQAHGRKHLILKYARLRLLPAGSSD